MAKRYPWDGQDGQTLAEGGAGGKGGQPKVYFQSFEEFQAMLRRSNMAMSPMLDRKLYEYARGGSLRDTASAETLAFLATEAKETP